MAENDEYGELLTEKTFEINSYVHPEHKIGSNANLRKIIVINGWKNQFL